MSKANIPALIAQYRENMLDETNSLTIRHNYRITLENIRDYCDSAIQDYDRKQKVKPR